MNPPDDEYLWIICGTSHLGRCSKSSTECHPRFLDQAGSFHLPDFVHPGVWKAQGDLCSTWARNATSEFFASLKIKISIRQANMATRIMFSILILLNIYNMHTNKEAIVDYPMMRAKILLGCKVIFFGITATPSFTT